MKSLSAACCCAVGGVGPEVSERVSSRSREVRPREPACAMAAERRAGGTM